MHHLFLTVLFTFAILFFSGCKISAIPEIPAKNGFVDLSDQQQLMARNPVKLAGEWQVVWGELVSPEKYPPHAQLTEFPGLWSKAKENEKNDINGNQATYRLKVKLPADYKKPSLHIEGPLSVVQVFIDNRMVANSGHVGLSASEEKPRRHLVTVPFQPVANSFELVMHISNHHNMVGGMNFPVLLGTTEQIELILQRKWTIGAILGGIFCIMGLCHLVLFVILRRKRANLYFGMFCLLWAVNTIAGETWGFLLSTLIPSLPWAATIYLTLVPYAFSIPLIVLFYHALFPKKCGLKFEVYVALLSLIYLSYLSMTPTNAFDQKVLIYNLVVAFTVFPYLFFQLIRDIFTREKDVLWLIPGYGFLGMAGFIDRMNIFNEADLTYLLPLSSFGFICCYSLVIVIRFTRTYKQTTTLSSELADARKQLERNITSTNARIKKSQIDQQRLLAVEIMRLSLVHWQETTGEEKAGFAERSKLWKVYVDQNGWQRTQTLDKYLSLETLPKRPKFSQVIQTGEYCLEIESKSSVAEILSDKLQQLKSL